MTDKEYVDRDRRPLREGCEEISDEPMRVVATSEVPSKGQRP
jgi:hypothetical protein